MGTFIQHGQRKVTYPKASVRPQGRPPQPFKSSRAAAPQEEEIGAGPKLLLHGRQVPRMLQHHHRLLPRPDRRPVRILLDRPLPANRRDGSLSNRHPAAWRYRAGWQAKMTEGTHKRGTRELSLLSFTNDTYLIPAPTVIPCTAYGPASVSPSQAYSVSATQ